MTLKEADEAAQKRLPVIHDGIEYQRIIKTGYHYDDKNGQRRGFLALLDKCGRSMEVIKTSENVEYDVIYGDGTRHHVSEGVLFEVKDNKLTFHNGTDRAEALIGVAEAAAEVVGAMGLNESERALIIYNIHKRIFGRKNAAADMEINVGGQNNGI